MRTKLTYANVMATIAVFIALGGASYAAIKLPKNSVGPKQIKKNAVTTAKIKDGAVTGPKLNLSTLGAVPEASHAKSADHASSADHVSGADTVGGLSVVKFERVGPVSSASPVTLVSLGGLQLDYSCLPSPPEDDILQFRATTSVDGASLWLSRTHGGGTELETKEPFSSGDLFPLTGFVND